MGHRLAVVLAALAASMLLAAGAAPGVGSTPGPDRATPTVDAATPIGTEAHGTVVERAATLGDADDHGSMRGHALSRPVAGMAATTTGRGYWLVAADGGIFSFGDASFHGSTGAMRLNRPIVGMAATPSGGGYWFVASDGGIFSFGDASFHGSTGGLTLNQPIVAMAPTPSGRGYWLVASDGGIFTFGDASFHGSTGGLTLNQPIVAMAPTPTGRGYWLVASDGGIFTFGDATFHGSTAGTGAQVTAMAAVPAGAGYWVAAADGRVTAFGDAADHGSAGGPARVVALATTPTGGGYWLAAADGDVRTQQADPVPLATPGDGPHRFLNVDGAGRPTRYDPCRPLRYVVNPAGAPPGAVAEVREGFRRLASATGIAVRDGGTTDERPDLGARPAHQPGRYGAGAWAPVLVAWAHAEEVPRLAGDTVAMAGSSWVTDGGGRRAYVTGQVVFDRADLGQLAPGFGTGRVRGNLVLHELGHLVGLDHVDDRSQMLHTTVHGATPDGYAAGDRAGLARLGAASGCVTVPAPA